MAAWAVPVMLLSTGCSAFDRGALDPRGPYARSHERLFLIALAIATVVVVVVLGLLAYALWRRRPAEGEADPKADLDGTRFVAIGGFAVPALILGVLMILTFVFLAREPQEGDLRIEVIGHQYWWEVVYPGDGVITANQVWLPVDRDVELVLTSDDVIHSFWVPELQGKADMVPGRTNRLIVRADETGVFRARCAEYCGLQHAQMALRVVVQEPDEFEATLEHLATPAVAQDSEGQRLFEEHACAACHTIRGTEANGRLGPDLTHFASRLTIGAGILDNEPGILRAWIVNPQAFKPGAEMPPITTLDEDAVDAIARYLESLQ